MRKLPDASIDLIITDPPYFIPIKHYKTRKYFNRNFADLGLIEYFFKDVFNEFKRIMKPTGRIYVFCDGQSYPLFWWHFFKFCKNVRPIIWDKKTSINGYSWRHQHELILFAEMPESKPVPSGDGDILRYSAVKVGERKHPAEKPVELIKSLVEKSSNQNDVVLDCFAGSGSVMKACLETNRQYIMIEKELSYFELMEQSDKPSTLPNDNFATQKSLISSLKDNSNELSQIEHHDEQNDILNSSSQCPTSLNNNIMPNFKIALHSGVQHNKQGVTKWN